MLVRITSSAIELRLDAHRSPPPHPRWRDSHGQVVLGTRHGTSLAAPTGAAPWPDVQPLAVATRGYYASTRQLQETPSILRRLSRRLRTIRPTPPAARAAPIPTTRAVAQTGGCNRRYLEVACLVVLRALVRRSRLEEHSPPRERRCRLALAQGGRSDCICQQCIRRQHNYCRDRRRCTLPLRQR